MSRKDCANIMIEIVNIYFGRDYDGNHSSLYIPTSTCPFGNYVLFEISLYY